MTMIAGVILAGGRSSRMGVEKSLMDFGGAPVIARVIARLTPQVAHLAINANGDPTRFARFGLPVIADAGRDQPGPLAGIAAGLAFARERGCAWLATAPCDAPFTPCDLVARLLSARASSLVAIACGARGLEPLFGLWSIEASAHIEAALQSGERAVHRVAAALGAAIVRIDNEAGAADWALNLNRPEDVAEALAQFAPCGRRA